MRKEYKRIEKEKKTTEGKSTTKYGITIHIKNHAVLSRERKDYDGIEFQLVTVDKISSILNTK